MLETKVVLFGEGGVGKTSLALRFCKGVFLQRYDPTVEDCFRHHLVVDDNAYMLEIVDTAGTDQFAIMRELYIKGGHGFILVFSIVSEQTFREINSYHAQILAVKEQRNVCAISLSGNKSDLEVDRKVERKDAEIWASEAGCPYIETSSKDAINVTDVFENIVRQIYPSKERANKQKTLNCYLL